MGFPFSNQHSPSIFTIAGATYFSSMYEAFVALTTQKKMFFEYWFAGKGISSIWQVAGVNTMVDDIDFGYALTQDGAAISLNDKRQFNHQASMFLTLEKLQSDAGSNGTYIGLGSEAGNSGHQANALHDSGNSNYKAMTRDGSTSSETATSIAKDTSNYKLHQGELTATNFKYSINNSLEVTKTTNLPGQKLQPHMVHYNTGESRIKYFSAWNT